MVGMYILAGSFAEVEKPALPEVFHIDDLLDFSCEDIGGPIVGGELQLSGLTVENSVNGGEASQSSSMEVKSELVEPAALEDIEVKTDLCVPVSPEFWCSCSECESLCDKNAHNFQLNL